MFSILFGYARKFFKMALDGVIYLFQEPCNVFEASSFLSWSLERLCFGVLSRSSRAFSHSRAASLSSLR